MKIARIKGGFPVGKDLRVHSMFTNAPSTLRCSMRSPNLHNLPRGSDPLASKAKLMFVAPEHFTFVARDFSGIEAVLVGWFAASQRYTRLAKLGVHDYFLAHGILKPARKITEADLPNLAWSDADLHTCFKGLKARFKLERDIAKRCVHLSNYLGTPGKMNEEYVDTFPTKRDAAIVQGAYFDLFPEISTWHKRTCEQVDKSGWVRAPSGFVHRFYRVLDWKKDPRGVWTSAYSDDSKRLIAFLPQHTAAWVGKAALKRLYNNHTELAQRVQAARFDQRLTSDRTWRPRKIDETAIGGVIDHPWLRLFIHDEILGEVPCTLADEIDDLLRREMETPVDGLPLDPAWNMGTSLVIGSEPKRGPSWGEMS